MPTPHEQAIVGRVRSIENPLTPWIDMLKPRKVVSFGDDTEPAFLDWDPSSLLYERVLRVMGGTRRPVHVDLSPERRITDVHIPITGRVLELIPTDTDDIGIRFERSASIHLLKRSHPDADKWLKDFAASEKDHVPLTVTTRWEDDTIIDVRPAFVIRRPICQRTTKPKPSDAKIVRDLVRVDLERLKRFLAALDICTLPAARAGCIAFTNVKDECWAKTHYVCKLLKAEGITSAKIWIYPKKQQRLQAPTPNLPECKTSWGFHVAALVKARSGNLHVVDPSLFPSECPELQSWKTYVGAAVERMSDLKTYRQETPDDCAPLCGDELEDDLAATRSALLALVGKPGGPPPYEKCVKSKP